MATVRSFHRYRGESSFTLPELLRILGEQLPLIAPQQTRYRVTTIPTERTFRFYTAQGLVDKPSGRQGQNALYGYRHLLQALAVKYLQSHYLPLRKVRSLVESASNRELEQLMPEIAPASWAHRGFTRADRRVVPGDDLPAHPRPGSAAPQAGGANPAGREPTAVPPAVAETFADGGVPDAWHRLEVGPGIELHVHAATLSAENRERLRGALLRELAALRGWFDGGGKD